MLKKAVRKLIPIILLCAMLASFLPASVHAETLPNGAAEVVFATRTNGGDGHWYANIGYWCDDQTRKMYGREGRLCKLNLVTGQLTTLLEDLNGGIRDPQVSYDGTKILFSYRKGGTDNYLLYEINTDGTNLKQLTYGIFDDYEPTYLPDGGIAFISSRCQRWVPCMNTEVGLMYRCDGDGKNIRILSAGIDQENKPWVMPNGKIIYMRWEYVDRSQMVYHHLWTMNPDGTEQAVFYGNSNVKHLGDAEAMQSPKPIPGTNKVVCTFGWGHGQYEQTGPLVIVDPSNGPDDTSKCTILKSGRDYKDPLPVTSDYFLASYDNKIVKIDGSGNETQLFGATFTTPIHEVVPVISRQREMIIPNHAKTDGTALTGKISMQNVNMGRQMAGVNAGEVKKILILEELPKPLNTDGNMPPITYNNGFMLKRIIGTIPVEADGSAYFEVPANRPLQFVALDENNSSIQRMMSFTTVQPGETQSCVGCHETRDTAPLEGPVATALQRAPSQITQLDSSIPKIYDFQRDVQPILDKYCVSCHSDTNRQGGVILTGDYGPQFTLSYYNLAMRKQVFNGGNLEKSNYPPRAIGDPVSPIMWKLGDRAKDVTLVDGFNNDPNKPARVVEKDGTNPHYGISMTDTERNVIKFWVHAGGTFAGTYASLGPQGIFPYMIQNVAQPIKGVPSLDTAATAITNRCNSCHTGDNVLPTRPDQHEPYCNAVDGGTTYWSGMTDDRPLIGLNTAKRNKHASDLIYNLSKPSRSVQLLAPLATSAGGYGICKNADGTPVFASTSDPDYQKLLTAINDTQALLYNLKRFDMTDFIPSSQWVREMKRFKVVPMDYNPYTSDQSVYDIEKNYFESLWCKSAVTERWGPETAVGGAAEQTRYQQLLSSVAITKPLNVAKGKTVVASSADDATNRPASKAVDGTGMLTRWSSGYTNNEWIYVDLGGTYKVNAVNLIWEKAYATGYKIQVSNDASTWTDVYTTTTGNGGRDYVSFNATNARYVRMLGVTRATQYGYSLYEFEVNAAMDTSNNLALNKTTTTSSGTGGLAVDGNTATRWSSSYSDPQWISVDLGSNRSVTGVRLSWETAYGKSYQIQTSTDGTNWTNVYSTTSGTGGIEEIPIPATTARYVRMYGTARGTSYGYSLWEFGVFGT